MAHDQRYVSEELCHFVGRGHAPEEQYDVLVNKVLRRGWLTHGPYHDPTAPRSLGLDLSKPISTDEMLKYQVVCFCDIPEADLRLHTKKYSNFGISFKKPFLIDKGACPVFYVANESPVPGLAMFNPPDFAERTAEAKKTGRVNRALYFDTTVRAILDLFAGFDAIACTEDDRFFKGLSADDFKGRVRMLLGLSQDQMAVMERSIKNNKDLIGALRIFQDFLINQIFTYVKSFESKTSIDDEQHYYMEREWRVGNNVSFAITDVSRVFFPQKYAKRFRNDIPEYIGQVSFID